MTIPSSYDLAAARNWHFAFAWLLVVPGLLYWLWSLVARHVQRDLAPTLEELRPSSIWHDVKNHARLRFPKGEEARRYNILQKLSYVGVLFGLLPAMVLTGLTMSPDIDAGVAVAARAVRRAAIREGRSISFARCCSPGSSASMS